MKRRQGFVANSSTSSFCINLELSIPRSDWNPVWNDDFLFVPDWLEGDLGWLPTTLADLEALRDRMLAEGDDPDEPSERLNLVMECLDWNDRSWRPPPKQGRVLWRHDTDGTIELCAQFAACELRIGLPLGTWNSHRKGEACIGDFPEDVLDKADPPWGGAGFELYYLSPTRTTSEFLTKARRCLERIRRAYAISPQRSRLGISTWTDFDVEVHDAKLVYPETYEQLSTTIETISTP